MTLVVSGITAAMIEAAEHSSFYGIYGDTSTCFTARRACMHAISDYLIKKNIDWNSFYILSAHSINTDGTPVPYRAEIDFCFD